MRIAWTGSIGPGGGVPGMGTLMLRELVRQGVEVDLYLTAERDAALPVEPMPGLRFIVRRVGWRWGRWYSRSKPTAFFSGLAVRAFGGMLLSVRLLAEHRRRPYDAVYQLSQSELFLLGRVGALAPPIVVHPCTHSAGELRWHRLESAYARQSERLAIHYCVRAWLALRSAIQRRELARADLVIGLSERFNELVHEDYGIPWARLRVLRTPVDLARFAPAPMATGSGDDASTLLFISRISTRKGVAEIVELSHRLADLAGAVRMIVIGGPTLWSDYRGHLRELNPAVAEYPGATATEDLPALLGRATMLLVPSRYEPGSIVTAEALACGLPVVLSDEVGNAEAAAGPHVRLHRARDVDDLEAAVRSALDAMRDDEPALRAAARANAEAQFAVGVVVSGLIELIAALRAAPVAEAAPDGSPPDPYREADRELADALARA